MRAFKRDNWTIDQVVHFMNDQKIVRGDGDECDYCKKHNIIIDDIVSFVETQGRPADDAWTNAEVFSLLESLRLKENPDCTVTTRYNGVIDDVQAYFYDFMRPVEEFGAMGYCEEEDIIHHIGGIPEEMSEQWKEKHIKQ